MRITALVENTALDSRFGAEHGLSLYIETEKHRILFDMGQTDLFSQNAGKLGIDLGEVDLAVLSHGHYDHGGGMKRFLEINERAPIYVNRDAFQPHYNGRDKYIGLDVSLADSDRLIFTDEKWKIDENLTLYTCNQNRQKYALGSFGLNMVQDGVFLPEDFRHEQYLLIEEKGKRVLLSGCSHKGIMDITRWFAPDVLIGGFHFSKLPMDETLKGYAECLNDFQTEYYTCHCTGTRQFAFMSRFMDRLHYLSSGQSIDI